MATTSERFGDAMTGQEPNYVTSVDWHNVGLLLHPLWMILGAVLGMTFSWLIAGALIPSMVATRDLPARMAKLRMPFYGAAVLFLLFGLFAIWLFVDRLGVLPSIFWHGAQ